MDLQTKTIAFTLPISCHICLGKVKQPVTCTNQHAFCKMCLQIWLERVPACPTCRTPINDQNPFRPILGGADDVQPSERQWDLLRARVEISLREYEHELEFQKNRSHTLENENKNLLEKLASQVERKEVDNTAVGDFTVLNEELREMKSSYERARREISELKKTNRNLTDQNVHLTREAHLLRLEVSKRSPQKFGRITVATLQSKLDDSEKKVKQLQKALEKTDEYVSELQSQVRKCKCSELKEEHDVKRETKTVNASKEDAKLTCQRNLMASFGEIRSEKLNDSSQKTSKMEVICTSGGEEHKSGCLVPASHHIAAVRVDTYRFQDGRTEQPKSESSIPVSNRDGTIGNVPLNFTAPSTVKMTSYRSATSLSKRVRMNEDK